MFPKTVITDCEGNPYLTRWHLLRFGEWFAIMLHYFHRSDEDRALHDHPWSFVTVLLSDGYWEHTPRGRTWKPRGSILYRPASWQHRVEIAEGTHPWTLVFRFKRFREWGFWTPQGFVHWQSWWRANCE